MATDFDPYRVRMQIERDMLNLKKAIESKNFKSEQELEAYINSLKGGDIESKLPPRENLTSLEQAQEMVYDAYNCPDPERSIELAQRALELCPDCADAYIILADEKAETFEEAFELYEKAFRAAERALGQDFISQNAGHFWGITETRPYMRARAGYAEHLWQDGKKDEAVAHIEEMLKLNPNDNQGLRWLLANWYYQMQEYSKLDNLFGQYEDDASLTWYYTKTLLIFRRRGDCDESKNALLLAFERNMGVAYIFLYEARPEEEPSDIVIDDEAESYFTMAADGWYDTPGAVDWMLKKTLHINMTDEEPEEKVKVGRNAPCPCGSGKKYKKCCGKGK